MPRGGRRPGAGRKRGHKEPQTLEREAVQAALNQRVFKAADRLFHAQMAQAEGVTFLFRKPKTGGPAKRVTDEDTLRRFFDGELDDDEAAWFFVATERPSAEAADRLLNRALGKAVEHLQMAGAGGGPVRVIHEEWHESGDC
jgi:hypothetical protein